MSAEMDSATKKMVEIHVRLLEEGTEVARPTHALDLGNGLFKLEATIDYDPDTEVWEFLPGSIVRGEIRSSDSGQYLMAAKP